MTTKIIADLTSNHMGNMEVLKSMIQALATCNVDIVKVQSWRADKLVKGDSAKRNYYKERELSDDDHWQIKEWCDDFAIEMLCTCFDLDRVDFLSKLGLRRVKVASPDLSSHTMIRKLMDNFEELIISTGSATMEEFILTIRICSEYVGSKCSRVTFLHCNSYYPCPFHNVNMKFMKNMPKLFDNFKDSKVQFDFGYSDHTRGTSASKYAICLGARFVEKHFTLSRFLPGVDQGMSTTVEEFKEISSWASIVSIMEGDGVLPETDNERRFRNKYIGKWGDNK